MITITITMRQHLDGVTGQFVADNSSRTIRRRTIRCGYL